MFRLLLLPFFMVISLECSAITLRGFFTPFVNNEAVVSVENETARHALVVVSVAEVDSPTSDRQINMQGGELLFTPSRQVIRKKGKANFRFIYKGPENSKERYFRVMFTETYVDRLTRKSKQEGETNGKVTPNLSMGYILTLPPSNGFQHYLLNRDSVTNVGNVSFVFRAYGKDKKGKEASIVIPLLPQQTVSLNRFNPKEAVVGYVDGTKRDSFTLAAEE
ncbi:hypothetical protein CK911_01350 [Aeromonas sp. CU5]|uniref:hypothetical protein n=1 Tax=Aeromonas sp. CU5 TaxID=2033033 RepID=UPI000BFBA9BD|nr:hypothetical protein [Aeromonas sp. CU5]ATL91584.1 hypothetical protein CK911_01350 [Aeromonas sp. CU5]